MASPVQEFYEMCSRQLEKDEVLRFIELAARYKLAELDLSWNQLKTLPEEIGELKNLITLDLAGNQLESLPPEIEKLTNLSTLDLSRNQLECLPPEIEKLTKLIRLDLSRNQLECLPPEIEKLTKLIRLDLYNNQLTTLPEGIGKLKNLTTLDLAGNQLESLPADIAELTNLTVLNLSYNQLESLPADIGKLKNLTSLFLSDNPLESPPPDIASKGIEAIRAYFKSLEGERRALNEVKVLLVGDGGAGKTSLVKQLLGEEFDKKEPPTHGINVRDWEVKEPEKNIKVSAVRRLCTPRISSSYQNAAFTFWFWMAGETRRQNTGSSI
jgi:Leucine-rich repeat (LRR) protein